jgi:hypothetical protein
VTPRRWLAAGAALTILGLAVATTAPMVGTDGAERERAQQIVGGIVVLLGWAALALGIHRFGRLADDGGSSK